MDDIHDIAASRSSNTLPQPSTRSVLYPGGVCSTGLPPHPQTPPPQPLSGYMKTRLVSCRCCMNNALLACTPRAPSSIAVSPGRDKTDCRAPMVQVPLDPPEPCRQPGGVICRRYVTDTHACAYIHKNTPAYIHARALARVSSS